jgi:hypothetical protein
MSNPKSKAGVRKSSAFLKAINLLCELSWIKTSKYYIPGETSEVEKLKTEAVEYGVILALRYAFEHTQSSQVKNLINFKVLQHLSISDIEYQIIVKKSFIIEPTSIKENRIEKELVLSSM